MQFKINRTSSDRTRKVIMTNSFTFTIRLYKNTYFPLHKLNLSKSSSNKYQLILARKEHPVSSHLKCNRGKCTATKIHV